MNIEKGYARRVIPLPKEFRVEGTVCLSPREIGVVHQVVVSPPLQTACNLISRFAQSKDTKSRFSIQLMLADSEEHPKIAERLSALPNKEQAYAIVPDEDRLSLIAYAPVGLLYAALTLSQLVGKDRNGEVEIPIVRITDWPDISERGQWGGKFSERPCLDVPMEAQRRGSISRDRPG